MWKFLRAKILNKINYKNILNNLDNDTIQKLAAIRNEIESTEKNV